MSNFIKKNKNYPKIREEYEEARRILFSNNESFSYPTSTLINWLDLLFKDISQLEDKVKILREALEFYAEGFHWKRFWSKANPAIESGYIAREALEKVKKEDI